MTEALNSDEPCRCPFCDSETEKQEPVCKACALTIVVCPICGKPLREELRECPECGAPRT